MADGNKLLVETAAELRVISEILANLMAEVAMLVPDPRAALMRSISAEEAGVDLALAETNLNAPSMRRLEQLKDAARARLFQLAQHILERRLETGS